MTGRLQEPHSRWRLRESLDRLAVSYDATARAIDTFTRATQAYDPHSTRRGAADRLRCAADWVAGRWDWARILWFAVTLLLTGSFLAWISLAIARRFVPGPVPVVLAAAPGVLVALTLGGTAHGLARTPVRTGTRSWLFAIALTGWAGWMATWLIGVDDLVVWFAAATAVLSAAVAGAAFLAASQPATTPPRQVLSRVRPARPPWRLLARQRAAQRRLRRHAGRWSIAAHACGLAVGGSPPAAAALNRLLSEGAPGELPVQDADAFPIQLLATLVRYQPDPLGARLRAASARLLPYQAHAIAPPNRRTRLWPPSTSTARSTYRTWPAAICTTASSATVPERSRP